MTENRCIEVLKKMKHIFTETCAKIDENTALNMAVEAIKEIQQYRAIGTVEELKTIKALCKNQENLISAKNKQLAEYEAIGTVEYIQRTFELCKGLDAMVKMYEEIGTIEEFKALKEKREPKKPIKHGLRENKVMCPHCTNWLEAHSSKVFCCYCGRKIDWSE